MTIAAVGKHKTPISPARLCIGWGILKTEAIAEPIPDAINNAKPTLPHFVTISVRRLYAKHQTFSAPAININDNNQPN